MVYVVRLFKCDEIKIKFFDIWNSILLNFFCLMNMEIEFSSNDFIFETKLGWISMSVRDPLLEPCALKTVSSLGKESSYNLEALECFRGACDCWNNLKRWWWPLELVKIRVHLLCINSYKPIGSSIFFFIDGNPRHPLVV